VHRPWPEARTLVWAIASLTTPVVVIRLFTWNFSWCDHVRPHLRPTTLGQGVCKWLQGHRVLCCFWRSQVLRVLHRSPPVCTALLTLLHRGE
jgi:hypothetical protein